ncbi:MAG: phytoene/squalene synthase family protein [Abitibacteriaceae bacterium]|nr:phytoene/squalene synthase family protein [Abditibacteriaceae bacterium]
MISPREGLVVSRSPVKHPPELSAAFEVARRLHRKHGKSYYFATRLFPEDVRLATYALYGFFRVPDEIVDTSPLRDAEDAMQVKQQLNAWQSNWATAYQTGDSPDPILRVTSYVFHRYQIPYEYSEHFLAAMLTDLEKSSYRDYDGLQQYMFGSAAVVGMMMAYVIGFNDANALHYARTLGYAMQLTNFLRDMDEDYQMRRRVYMPQDELANYGLSNEDIAARRYSKKFEAFVIYQAARAHSLYEEANEGIALLQPQGRIAVRVASSLYRAILNKIEAQQWDVFRGRARTNFPEKIMLMAEALRTNRE